MFTFPKQGASFHLCCNNSPSREMSREACSAQTPCRPCQVPDHDCFSLGSQDLSRNMCHIEWRLSLHFLWSGTVSQSFSVLYFLIGRSSICSFQNFIMIRLKSHIRVCIPGRNSAEMMPSFSRGIISEGTLQWRLPLPYLLARLVFSRFPHHSLNICLLTGTK